MTNNDRAATTEPNTHRVLTWTKRDGVISVSPDMPEQEARALAKLGAEANPSYVNFLVERAS